EPRAASAKARLRAIARLTAAGVPVGALIAPVIPALNDHEIERLVAAVSYAGAVSAGYVLLRLPWEVRDLFVEWLETHYRDRAAHVMSLVRQSRGGRDYDPSWGSRMRGTGGFAELIEKRFALACRKAGLGRRDDMRIRTDRFRVPERSGDQFSLRF
ncbi:MAG: PA0069 family radical SAM protein, partial [Candidatus Wenzhouxiangella sp. M2_3B_020]